MSQVNSFILELAKLIAKSPKHALPMQDCENSDYNSFLYKSKNCYLCFSSSFLEDCMFMETCSHDKDCADCTYVNKCELCYECLDCTSCYNCNFCQDCKNSRDCEHCYECHGCENCFGCVGLRRKQFHIFNQAYSKEDYRKKIKELRTWPQEKCEQEIEKLRLKYPHQPMHIKNGDEVFGDYIENSKNCYMCFNVEKAEDCAYVYDEIYDLKDCFDCDHIHGCELCYNLMSAYQCYNVNSSWWMTNCRDCEFGITNVGCSDCFGCVGVSRKKYCILNQQYTKEEYEKRTAEIKKQLRAEGLYGKYLITDAWELAKTL